MYSKSPCTNENISKRLLMKKNLIISFIFLKWNLDNSYEPFLIIAFTILISLFYKKICNF